MTEPNEGRVAGAGPAGFADVDAGLLSVRPGDTLIIRVDPSTTAEAARDLMRQVDEWAVDHLPGVRAVVIAAEQLGVYRPDGRPGASGG